MLLTPGVPGFYRIYGVGHHNVKEPSFLQVSLNLTAPPGGQTLKMQSPQHWIQQYLLFGLLHN